VAAHSRLLEETPLNLEALSYDKDVSAFRFSVALVGIAVSCSVQRGASQLTFAQIDGSVPVPGSSLDDAGTCAGARDCEPGQICCVMGATTACQTEVLSCPMQACASSGECLVPGQRCTAENTSNTANPGMQVCQPPKGPIQSTCPQGQSTTLSGTVYDPANARPVYNAVVYVPSTSQLAALPQGITCEPCSVLYTEPLAGVTTDATGHFSMTNAPSGQAVPLVVQVGKWRMLYTISVNACEDNPQPDHSLHLPRSQIEGDLPNIAVSTGAEDSLECLLSRMGIAASEYTAGAAGPGRVHIFTGYGGASTPDAQAPDPAAALWDSATDITQFDMVLLSCEGVETKNMNQQVLFDYASAGGHVFATHFHYAWFNTGPFATATPPIATWTAGANCLSSVSSTMVTTEPTGASFAAGTAMITWLADAGALGLEGAPAGELEVNEACHNADVSDSNSQTQAWLSADMDSGAPGAAEAISFKTPLGSDVEATCGEVVYTDIHVSGGPGGTARGSLPPDYASDAGGTPICPDQCATGALSPQEEALEFLLLHLAGCNVLSAPPLFSPPVLTTE
jgi:hypothetical protein